MAASLQRLADITAPNGTLVVIGCAARSCTLPDYVSDAVGILPRTRGLGGNVFGGPGLDQKATDAVVGTVCFLNPSFVVMELSPWLIVRRYRPEGGQTPMMIAMTKMVMASLRRVYPVTVNLRGSNASCTRTRAAVNPT